MSLPCGNQGPVSNSYHLILKERIGKDPIPSSIVTELSVNTSRQVGQCGVRLRARQQENRFPVEIFLFQAISGNHPAS
jgi:hypothetical protein